MLKNNQFIFDSRHRPNLSKFKRLTDVSELHEGMVLIDKNAHKRTVLSLTGGRILLSHKGGYRHINRFLGKDHAIEDFMRKFGRKNWIYQN